MASSMSSGVEEKVRQEGSHQKEVLLEIIVDPKSVFDEDGKLCTPKCEVWSTLSMKLSETEDVRMTPKHIYVFFNRNRHNIQNELRKKAGFEPLVTSEHPDSCDEEQIIRPKETFQAVISPAQWAKMKPVRQETPCSGENKVTKVKYVMPRNGWAYVLTEIFWSQQDITCPFVFKRATVRMNFSTGKKFVSFSEGKCQECGGTAEAWIDNPPTDNEPAIVLMRATDSRLIPHTRKRQLRGTERVSYKSQLRTQTPEEIRRAQAGSSKTAGKGTAPNIYSKEVLRKAKQEMTEELFKEMGIPIGPKLFDNLLHMKNSQPFVGSIHIVCQEPVCVIYNTPTQLIISRDLCRRRYSRMSVDATGNCVSRIVKENGRSRRIFLYQLVGEIEEETVPLNQMLSERHHANIILFWLNEGVRRGFGTPNEIVCDDSPALLVAAARSFAECPSLSAYVKQCFDVLRGTSKQLPKCFIRMDLAHFNKSSTGWKFWNQHSILVKEHLLRWLGLLTASSSMEHFSDTLYHIFVVTLSETCEIDSEVFQSKTLLIDMVARRQPKPQESRSGENDESDEEDVDSDEVGAESDEDETESDEDEEDDDQSVKEWVEEVYLRAQHTATEQLSVEDVNAYYSLEFAKALKRLAARFVLWTAVMTKPFKSPYETASSGRVEAYYHTVKSSAFKEFTLPTAISKFVGVHLRSIEGQVKLAAVNIPDDQSDDETLNNSQKELNKSEDWMGQASQDERKKTESKSKYLSPYPPMDIEAKLACLHDPREFLLRNGNLTSYQILHSGGRAQVSNTCAFDSFVQILAVGVLDQPHLRPFIEGCAQKSPTMKVVWSLAHHGAVADTFIQRLMALIPVGRKCAVKAPKTSKKKPPAPISRYDVEGNAQTLLGNLDLGFSSQRVVWVCPDGHKQVSYDQILRVNENLLEYNGIQHLEEAIIKETSVDCRTRTCKNKGVCVETKAEKIILIDCSCKEGQKSKLSDVPVSLQYNDYEFHLLGVIAYQPGHYVSYARRLQGFWELFNDVNKHPYRTKQDALVFVEVAVYFKS